MPTDPFASFPLPDTRLEPPTEASPAGVPLLLTVGPTDTPPAWAVPAEPLLELPPPIWSVPSERDALLEPPAMPLAPPSATVPNGVRRSPVGPTVSPPICAVPAESDAVLPPPA